MCILLGSRRKFQLRGDLRFLLRRGARGAGSAGGVQRRVRRGSRASGACVRFRRGRCFTSRCLRRGILLSLLGRLRRFRVGSGSLCPRRLALVPLATPRARREGLVQDICAYVFFYVLF